MEYTKGDILEGKSGDIILILGILESSGVYHVKNLDNSEDFKEIKYIENNFKDIPMNYLNIQYNITVVNDEFWGMEEGSM